MVWIEVENNQEKISAALNHDNDFVCFWKADKQLILNANHFISQVSRSANSVN